MLTIFLRSVILYAASLLAMRAMGKRQVGQLQPFELVVVIMIAELAATPMGGVGIPILYGLLPMAALVVCHGLLTALCMKSERVRVWLCGQPTVLVRNGVICEKQLRACAVDLNDLMEAMRAGGILDPLEVGTAVLEPGGNISVFPKADSRPLMPSDLGKMPPKEGLPLPLILDGEVQTENLQRGQLSLSWLMGQIRALGFEGAQDVLLLCLNTQGMLLGGDYARDKWSAAAFFENLPRRISSNYGVYAVVGECDRSPLEKGEEPSTLRNKMSKAGVTLLCNEVATLRIGTSDIYIAGIDDVSTEMDDAKSVAAQVNSKDFVIFLAHNPSVISSSLLLTDRNGRGNWFDLGLFGHTHGGQIPFLEEAFNFNGVPSRYESGLLLENRSWLLISRGVGTTGLPARLFCPPEIHLITVQSGT